MYGQREHFSNRNGLVVYCGFTILLGENIVGIGQGFVVMGSGHYVLNSRILGYCILLSKLILKEFSV